MINDSGDDPLLERLHAARRALAVAYERRDALTNEVGMAQRSGSLLTGERLRTLSLAERAVLAAEADMKDAEHALAVAT